MASSTCCARISRAGRSAFACSSRAAATGARHRVSTSRSASAAWPTATRCLSNGEARARPTDLFDVKGDLASLVAPRALTTERAEHPVLHPGRAARVRVDAIDVGWLGELHPRIAKAFELPRAPILFELDLATARRGSAARGAARVQAPRSSGATLPSSSTTPFPRRTSMSALEAAKPPHVDTIGCSTSTGVRESILAQKSLAILVLMQDTERTLTDVDIDATMAELLRILAVRFGATLRQ